MASASVCSNNGGGRRKHENWEHVDLVTKQCIHCKEILSKSKIKIERVTAHLKKCKQYLKSVADIRSPTTSPTKKGNVISLDLDKNDDLAGGPSTCTIQHKKHTGKQRSIKDHVIITNAEQSEKIDLKIANFFYSCNISFSIIDNPSFLAMLHGLRPGYFHKQCI